MWPHPGIGRYLRETSFELLKNPAEFKFTFYGSPKVQEAIAEYPSASFQGASSPIYSLKEQWEMARLKPAPAILHVPHFNIPVFYPGRLVVTVHDLIYLHDPAASKSRFGRAYVRFLLKTLSKKAAAVIAVSEFTKNDLLKQFSALDPKRVFVIHEAASEFFKPAAQETAKKYLNLRFGLTDTFALFVGTLKPHKNISVLVEAMSRARKKQGFSEKLVVVGRKDAKFPEIEKLVKGEKFIQYLGEVSDEDLRILYSLASVFILPSLWEGFGIPVLEAMACGAPVISSNAASLPEAAGDAAELFHPKDADALEKLLCQVLSDPAKRAAMSEKSLKQAARFSWKKAAAETLSVYRKVLA